MKKWLLFCIAAILSDSVSAGQVRQIPCASGWRVAVSNLHPVGRSWWQDDGWIESPQGAYKARFKRNGTWRAVYELSSSDGRTGTSFTDCLRPITLLDEGTVVLGSCSAMDLVPERATTEIMRMGTWVRRTLPFAGRIANAGCLASIKAGALAVHSLQGKLLWSRSISEVGEALDFAENASCVIVSSSHANHGWLEAYEGMTGRFLGRRTLAPGSRVIAIAEDGSGVVTAEGRAPSSRIRCFSLPSLEELWSVERAENAWDGGILAPRARWVAYAAAFPNREGTSYSVSMCFLDGTTGREIAVLPVSHEHPSLRMRGSWLECTFRPEVLRIDVTPPPDAAPASAR